MYSYIPLALALVPSLVSAQQAQSFTPPAPAPSATSSVYVGKNNGTIQNSPVVAGKSFDRFIQIWLENTDYATAASSPVFQSLAQQGLSLSSYYAVTHPSEPNYVAAAGGDFFGMNDDSFYAIPQNVSTIVDLLEAKNVSWATYQENAPYDGYTAFNYTEKNYINSTAGNYTYYVRKHNPLIIYDSVANVTSRALRSRNFNDFAADLNANALPQWIFVTPNLVNDAHDTTIDFASAWLNYWLVPLLNNPNFNNNRTLILLTFDETETYTVNNRIVSILLGGAVPAALKGQTDDTYYTHYSTLSTVEANWGLGSLGRQDTNKTVSNVISFVANATGYQNLNISGSAIPLTNITGTVPGPLNAQYYFPYVAPNMSAVGAGGGPVFAGPGLNTTFTQALAGSPVNLTAQGKKVPSATDPGIDYASGNKTIASASSASNNGSSVSPSSSSVPGAASSVKVAGSVVAGAAVLVGALALVL